MNQNNPIPGKLYKLFDKWNISIQDGVIVDLPYYEGLCVKTNEEECYTDFLCHKTSQGLSNDRKIISFRLDCWDFVEIK